MPEPACTKRHAFSRSWFGDRGLALVSSAGGSAGARRLADLFVPNPGKKGLAVPLFSAGLHLLALGLAWALKLHYSRAGAEDLLWILSPLARLAGFLCGLEFTWVAAAGFVHHARGLCIAPACAGVNFLILSFVALHLVFMTSFRPLRPGWRTCLAWAALFPGAWTVALLVNALRVAGSVFLYEADIYRAWFTPELVHEVFGICLYLAALAALCTATRAVLARSGHNAPFFGIVLGCYFGMTVLLPLCNGAATRYDSRFLLHAALVSGCLLLAAFLRLAVRHCKRAAGAEKSACARRDF